MNKTSFLRLLSLLLCVIIGMVIGQYMVYNKSDLNRYIPIPIYNSSAELSKLQLVFDQINEHYVDPVNIDSLIEKTISFIMEELDPHSVYIPASSMAQANESIEGSFDGIGVTFNMPNDTVVVIKVFSGGPSERAGVQPGDRIITVSDSLIAGQEMDLNQIIKMLRGKTGTEVIIGVERYGETNLIQIPIIRGKIPIKSVDVAYMINNNTGYIKLSKFSKTSHMEFLKAALLLQNQGMTNLVFDLRGNTGGLLDQSFEIANEFLKGGSLIVYTEGRARKRQNLYSDGRGHLKNINVAILVDEATASASEIVAGALQDNDRGIIVGFRSFGKGLVQEPINFSDNSGIRLTVARYYTPTGRSIQKPYTNYEDDIHQRYLHGEFLEVDSIKQDINLRYTTPGGKVVYGGGGITPDVFVPFDTTGINDYFLKVSRRNLIYRFALQFSDNHRTKINSIRSMDQLLQFYKPYHFVSMFTDYASRNGIKPKPGEIKECGEIIETHLKAYIGRSTPLDDDGYYPFIAKIDTTLQRAVEELQKEL
jgi:carboxyl-terminal processing protease